MLQGGNGKYQKMKKKRPGRFEDDDRQRVQQKPKHHDKSFYRLAKEEKEYDRIS